MKKYLIILLQVLLVLVMLSTIIIAYNIIIYDSPSIIKLIQEITPSIGDYPEDAFNDTILKEILVIVVTWRGF